MDVLFSDLDFMGDGQSQRILKNGYQILIFRNAKAALFSLGTTWQNVYC